MAIEFRLIVGLKRHVYLGVETKLQRNVLITTMKTFDSNRITDSTERVVCNVSRSKIKLFSVATP
jgi:hypothetical protein